MAEVSLRNVRKSYDGVTDAIPGLDLLCRDGEMLALLGPSGCGKSSTLKMIAGLEQVSDGAIYFGDVDVSAQDPSARNVAMVFEDYALYSHLTVFENIAFPLRIRSYSRRDIDERVNRVLAMLGLESKSSASVRKLSGGAQQRVSIGRALVREPALIMFDEPLSHMDSDQKVMLRSEIKRLQKMSGLTSVLVTHDQTEAISMADRVAVMDQGVLQQVDVPLAIYAEPANLFVAGFIGEPPMNILACRIEPRGDTARLVLAENTTFTLDSHQWHRLRPFLSAQEAIVGLRPEYIALGNHADSTMVGEVRVCETRGDHDVITLDTPVGKLVAEVGGPSMLREGARVPVSFDVSHLHFFNPVDGRNVLAATP
jgi:multiple sugar transport system ATP-binding protein